MFAESAIKVTFPEQPENAIYELVATVAITDTLGITGEVQHRVWSHFLSGTQNELVEKILPAIPRLIGVSNSDLVAASKFEHSPDERRIAKDAQLRHARMVRLLAMHASVDGRITVGELRSLLDSAKSASK